MIGFSKKVERRSFKYYPRHTNDSQQEQRSPFAKHYHEKKEDSFAEQDLNKSGKTIQFKRGVKLEKQKEFYRKIRVNLILIMVLMLLIVAAFWVVNNTDFFYSYSNKWAI